MPITVCAVPAAGIGSRVDSGLIWALQPHRQCKRLQSRRTARAPSGTPARDCTYGWFARGWRPRPVRGTHESARDQVM